MSYSFGARSQKNIESCHAHIQDILRETIKIVDFTVLCGHRGAEEQDKAFHEGRSKLKFPKSSHNVSPSNAVDIAPYPIDWENKERFYHLIGIVKGIAYSKGIAIRCGGDWDGDGDITDQTFFDLPHIELVNP